MEKYRNKYRIPSARASWWDYRWNALYFVTICTKNKEHFFGNVINGGMQLSEIGEIAKIEWLKTFEMRLDMNLFMGEYVIMPNHFHAIIGIGENQYNDVSKTQYPAVETQCFASDSETQSFVSDSETQCFASDSETQCIVSDSETQCIVSLQGETTPHNRFGPQSKNLASIIRGFKIGVTKQSRLINADFAWQTRYHDHIIRNQQSYIYIADYIKNNSGKWEEDKFYSSN
jgi:REP element-mobilizing transposase RayT